MSITLPAGRRTLVITGPNTGGKTATLKMVGLFHLMAQAGFLVPAEEGSGLRVFGAILADIGDEQSLTQSLSTFSSHVARIAGFFEDLAPPALVVLDELGAGTDPREGEALGLALLQELDHRGVNVVASTHYGGIKAYALGAPSVLSVAMEWDEETLRPTYRLVAGASGSSHALPIARRLAIPPEVLERADRILAGSETEETRTVAELTRELAAAREERDALRTERGRLDGELRAAREMSSQIRERKSRLSEERTQILAETRRRVRGIVAFVEEQSSKLLAEASRLSASELRQRRKAILAGALDALEKPATIPDAVDDDEQPPPERAPPAKPVEPAVGVAARLRQLGVEGTITAMDGRGRLQVDVKGKRMWVGRAEVELLAPTAPPAPSSSYTLRAAQDGDVPPIAQELSLLGFRVEEAIEATDRYLDQAVMAGLPSIRIVHGFGTGRLRAAIQDYLRKHPHVKATRPGGDGEGGGGATVVTLR
ncbi:MAG: Smr/MutS family protein [Acidobacteriota bacterium]